MDKEIWRFYIETKRKIVYEVSNLGRVKRNGIVLDINLNMKYYKIGGLFMLHIAVAELYVPNPDNKPFVDHIDGNTHNNRADNLRWVTAKENVNNPNTLLPRIEKQNTKEYRDKRSKLSKGENNGMFGKHLKDLMTDEEYKTWKINQKASCQGELNGMFGKNHKSKSKELISDDRKKRIWITDGVNERAIYKNEVIPDGWYRGRSKKNARNFNKQRLYVT